MNYICINIYSRIYSIGGVDILTNFLILIFNTPINILTGREIQRELDSPKKLIEHKDSGTRHKILWLEVLELFNNLDGISMRIRTPKFYSWVGN